MDIRAIGMGLAFALIWSSAFTTGKMIVEAAPPLTALTFRFLLSGLVGMGLAFAMGQRLDLSRAQWRAAILFGVMQNAFYLGMNFTAMQWVGASVAAIIASAMPLMVGLAGWLVFREKLKPLAIAGLVIGFGGVLLIMGARLQGGVDPLGITLCLLAAVALTVATMAMRSASGQSGNLLMVVGVQMLVGAVVLGTAALGLEEWQIDWSWRLIWAFLYTSLVPGLLATWIWFKLVARIGAVKGATFHFLNPFFGVLIAWALLGETISLTDILGVAVIAAGILAVQLSKQAKAL